MNRVLRRQLHQHVELLHTLVYRNLKVRYRGSVLGVYWSMLNPLLMTGVYTAVFGATFASYYGDSILKYMLAVFTGLSVIHFFSAATSQALGSVVENGALLNKISLPASLFPASTVMANAFQFVVGTLPLLILLAVINSHSLVTVIALALPLLALTCVSLGAGFLLSALYVFFRDLPYFYEIAMYALRIGTPVFYPAEIVPEKIRGFVVWNPLSMIIESVRNTVLLSTMPSLQLTLALVGSSAVVLTVGWGYFQIWRHHYMDLL